MFPFSILIYKFINIGVNPWCDIIGCLYEPVRWQLEGKGNYSVVMFLLQGVFEKSLWFYRRGETYKNMFYG